MTESAPPMAVEVSPTTSIESSSATVEEPSRWVKGRIIMAFWLLGLCNNYVYVIMLSAAHDVISKIEKQEPGNDTNVTTSAPTTERDCNDLSTGAILLADIVPTLFVKLIFPFLPFFVNVRIGFAVTTGILALVLVGTADTLTIALLGVCFASFNSGLGELTLLAYSTLYPLIAVAAWSSGTGGAGVIGAFAYAGMTEGGLTPEMSLFVSIIFPVLMAISFWIILSRPTRTTITQDDKDATPALEIENGKATSGVLTAWRNLLRNLKYIPKLLPFMIPVGLVYYFEYLINSGLALNVVILTLEAIYGFIPNVWILFVIIFWEGLLGGAAYVNTFYRMSQEIPEEKRLFALSIASVADTFGIVSAGFSSFPVHDAICKMPYDPIFRWPK